MNNIQSFIFYNIFEMKNPQVVPNLYECLSLAQHKIFWRIWVIKQLQLISIWKS